MISIKRCCPTKKTNRIGREAVMKETKVEVSNARPDIRFFQAAKWYHPEVGGIETVAKAITGAVADIAKTEILVCSGNKKRIIERTESGAYLYRAKTLFKLCSTPLSLDYIFAFARMSKRADVIQLHAPFPLSDLALFLCGGRRDKIKTVWYHCDAVRQKRMKLLYKPLLRWTLKQMNGIYVADSSIAEQSEYLAPYKDKVKVIPFGIPIEEYEKAERKPVLTARLNNAEHVKLLFAGRLVYYKGVDILIKAMASVRNAELFVIGGGEQEKTLREAVSELRLEDKVHFLGRADTALLRSAFSDCDVFILPSVSRAECFGLVQLEAMAYGKPVINTSLPTAVPKVSIDGKTGITVPPADAIALAGAIQRLTDDKELRKKYGENAKKRCSEFSLEKMERSLVSSYEELLGQKLREEDERDAKGRFSE